MRENREEGKESLAIIFYKSKKKQILAEQGEGLLVIRSSDLPGEVLGNPDSKLYCGYSESKQ